MHLLTWEHVPEHLEYIISNFVRRPASTIEPDYESHLFSRCIAKSTFDDLLQAHSVDEFVAVLDTLEARRDQKNQINDLQNIISSMMDCDESEAVWLSQSANLLWTILFENLSLRIPDNEDEKISITELVQDCLDTQK